MKRYKIICSAIKEHDTGEVWLGKRHSDCIWLMNQFDRHFTSLDQEGFWVIGSGSLGKFVSRREAYLIEVDNGNRRPPTKEEIKNNNTPELCSEDIFFS